ncbi:MAG: CDP-alcohol phosphatidyltransferase family protein [Beduini sp.]|uniref:CDP-alcohol phosphatidyltransferase family protein n=1 Tax=Beduini sp. TaxID=1922300 RepID=UPI0039A05815
MNYKEILDFSMDYSKKESLTRVAIGYPLKYIAIFFTKYLLKSKLTPNELTIGMILSGIMGAFLFCMPSIWIKIIGIIFIWLWFVLDICDGIVARIKKQFSKFGKELDYCAHVINHPLFNLSFMITVLQITKDYRFSILFFLIVVLNLAYRFFNCINIIYINKMKEVNLDIKNIKDVAKFKRLIIFCINFFIHFPNYALIFPIICLINLRVALIYSLLVILINLIYIPYIYIKFIFKIKDL